MKLNTQTLENHWQEIRSKLQEKWGSLNDQDLQKVRGDLQQLVQTIQQKTGETRDAVQSYLDELAVKYSGKLQQAQDALRDYAGRAAEGMQEARDQARETVRTGARQTRQVVRRHPVESLLTVFGVGVFVGVIGGLVMRSK